MVRNNRRKAFTIVEIVIVIAVIAILAAVMIPTFSGIIKRANISADVQLSASINTQLSIYKAEGNKIETEADLINALKSDFDFIANLNPKSAKHGYHYWYNAAENKVEVLTYAEVLAKQSQATMSAKPVYLAAGDGAAEAAVKPETFAHASPRTVVPGFYLLDQKNGEGENVIAEFFAAIEGMGKSADASGDYTNAINELTAISQSEKNDNKDLAVAILAKINATAIMTNKGTFINTTTEVPTVNYIYIPATPENATDYYLNHTVTHANGESVEELSAEVTGTIEIPAGVKVAEGSFVNFGAITVKVATDKVADLENILCADAVHKDATVVLSNDASYKALGSIVTDAITSEVQDVTLPCRNPITGFVIGTSNDSNAVSGYIALDKINSGITLNLTTGQFTAKDESLPAYKNVIWRVKKATKGETEIAAEDAKVTITEEGKVEFQSGFNADTITFTATATAGGKAVDYPVTVVTFDNVTTTFNGATATLDRNNTVTSTGTLFVAVATEGDGSIKTTASFSEELAYVYSGVPFTSEQLATLGVDPTVTITTTPNYFSKDSLYTAGFTFNIENVQKLTGGYDMQAVTITANVAEGISYSGNVDIKVKDNTNSPYYDATPDYKTELNYTYKVGNDELPISEIFAKKENIGGNISDHKVYVFANDPVENYFYSHIDEYNLSDFANAKFDFSKNVYTVGKTYYLVIGTEELDQYGNPKVSEDETVSAIVKVELVNGLNVLGDADFRTPAANVGLVLHNDFTNTKNEDTVVKLVGASIYGNYFTITADKYTDTDRDTKDGFSFIAVQGGTQDNPATINQLVINGPVYKTPAMSAQNTGIGDTLGTNPNGNFCNGINTHDFVVINDCYIYGFNSTVRVRNGSFEANGTIFEGGAWSNIFIEKATKFVLTDCTTLQKRGGYTTTMGGTEKVLGMGIYVHEDMNSNPTTLNIELNNTKQYNWLSSSDTDKGLFLSLAVQEIFKNGSVASQMEFYHTVNGTKYVNCTVASLGVNLKMGVLGRYSSIMEVKVTQKFDVDTTGGYIYDGAQELNPTTITIFEVFGSGAKADVTGNVHSYRHADQTKCDCANEINYTYSIAEFLADKLN